MKSRISLLRTKAIQQPFWGHQRDIRHHIAKYPAKSVAAVAKLKSKVEKELPEANGRFDYSDGLFYYQLLAGHQLLPGSSQSIYAQFYYVACFEIDVGVHA